MIYLSELERAIEELGIAGGQVCVHSSMKSFGDEVEGGLEGIIHTFLKKDCTLMAPTFSYDYLRRALPGYMPERNGINYEEALAIEENPALVFNRDSKRITADHMGQLAKQILAMPQSRRGNHPVNSFTAVGRYAERLVGEQSPKKLYAPFQQLYEDGGVVLLMGVGLERATIIHYAEQSAGRTPFVRWANDTLGRPIPVSIGGCSGGFGNFKPLLKEKKQVWLGKSLWQCYQARMVVDVCKQAILRNPEITRCGETGCKRCQDAIAGGPVIHFEY